MKQHPLLLSWKRTATCLLLLMATALSGFLALASHEASWAVAAIDVGVSVVVFAALGYAAWFVFRFFSEGWATLWASLSAWLLWTVGCLLLWNDLSEVFTLSYNAFLYTYLLRLLFVAPLWAAWMLWYRLLLRNAEAERLRDELLTQGAVASDSAAHEYISRIVVKDRANLHIIEVVDLMYIRACGDYVSLVTAQGEFVKEETMKQLELQLPPALFVRIHRSIIVNVSQIARVEQYSKSSYLLGLKNGIKLRVSLTGYQRLREVLRL